MLAVLAASFLFMLGQGALRPSMPMYLQQVFGAKYRMVTLIPTVFGAGKWIASVPTGHLLDRLGRRRLMVGGLLVIACSDVASAMTSRYGVFLGLRGLAGVGWAMFGTVATTTMVDLPAARRRARAVSALLMSETSGLLLGSAAGGWLYQAIGAGSPFALEAACMLAGALVVGGATLPSGAGPTPPPQPRHWRDLGPIARMPVVVVMGVTSAMLVAVQTGVVVFLFPLYLLNRADVTPAAVGGLVSVSVIGRLLALWLVGRISDQARRLRLLPVGLLGYAVLLASVTFVTHPALLALWSLALGGVAGFVAPLPTAILGDAVAPAHHGPAVGWLRTLTDTGQILGPLVLGALADAGDLSTPFYAGAAVLTATAWWCRRRAGTIASAMI